MALTSRHIYILAAALINLVLGSHAGAATARGVTRGQWVGSVLLALSAVLLIAAFVYEPVAGRYATALSRYGISSLFLGAIFHVGAGLRAGHS